MSLQQHLSREAKSHRQEEQLLHGSKKKLRISRHFWGIRGYPLVDCYIPMEHHHSICSQWKTRYFNRHVQLLYATNCQRVLDKQIMSIPSHYIPMIHGSSSRSPSFLAQLQNVQVKYQVKCGFLVANMQPWDVHILIYIYICIYLYLFRNVY